MSSLVSIIIINYRSGEFLRNCIQSVYAETTTIPFEILLVDNSPEDGACAELLQFFPEIKYIPLQANEGFARANNAGIKMANGDLLLLLNSDTVIGENAIATCAKRLQLMSDCVAAGVQLQYANGSPQISGSYNLTGGLNFLMTIPYIGKLLRQISLMAGVKKPSIKEASPSTMPVDWISGAYLMVKKFAIDKAGMLDPDFFLYHEESEWCGRLQHVGKLCLYGDLHVTHLEGASANDAFASQTGAYSNLSDRKGFQLLLSMLLRIRKQFGLFWFLFHFLFHTLSIPFVLVAALLHVFLAGSKAGAVIGSALGYSNNVLKTWPYLSRMIANTPFFYKVL